MTTGSIAPPPDAAERTVLDAIERRIPDWYGVGARLAPDTEIQRRAWSIHFLPTVVREEGTIELIVKIPLWEEAPNLETALQAGPQEATRAEHEMLCRIGTMVAAAADQRLTAVRGIGYVEEVNAVVTERLTSTTVRHLGRQQRVEAARALGAWIRRFHDEIGAAVGQSATAADIESLAGNVDAERVSLPGALRDAIAAIRQDAAVLVGHPLRIAVTHGDLGPSNVLVTPDGRVAVIDPNLVRGPVEADLAKFAVAQRTGRARLLTGVSFGSQLHPVEAAVLDGYGPVSPEVYRLCRRAAAAGRWIEIETETSGMRRLALPMARRVLRAETR